MNAPLPAPIAPMPMLAETARPAEERRARQPSRNAAPATSGRWWFAFDRWLVVAERGDQDSEFVLG